MKGMFQNCSSLISMPDISNWELSKVKIYQNIISGHSKKCKNIRGIKKRFSKFKLAINDS